MNRLKAVYELFTVGHRLAQPEGYKNAQLWGSLLVSLFGLAETFGIFINMSGDVATGLAMVGLGLVNAGITVTTTRKIGLPSSENN
jgi:hypothetical protein